ncbi:MAG: hypothetical protein H0T62_10805, partial [Parachlamydiaceae bacterium]|nr:hypothetical protein [Parachlamydiaceae bacterium]
LNRVRSIEPIIFTKNSDISEQLKEKCDDYYVLSEAVLGGVFIALGKSIVSTQVQSGDKDFATISKIQMCSFFSQGAILQIKDSRDKIDMWSIYSDWKESLKDDYAGFPIRFKFRELRSILHYNKIQIPKQIIPKLRLLSTQTNLSANFALTNQPQEELKDDQANKRTVPADVQLQ